MIMLMIQLRKEARARRLLRANNGQPTQHIPLRRRKSAILMLMLLSGSLEAEEILRPRLLVPVPIPTRASTASTIFPRKHSSWTLAGQGRVRSSSTS